MTRLRPPAWLPLLAVVLASACEATEPYEKPLTPVLVAEARLQATGQRLRYAAVVEPINRVDLAFRVGGYVTTLAQVHGRAVQEGDSVAAGVVLASVRGDAYDARIRLGQAGLAEARASRAAASQALARAEALYESRSLTKPELEQARAGLDAIDARIAAAEAQVREANLTRADADLRAPFAGVILKRHVDVGSLASPGAPAFSLADLGTVKVVIGVPDTMLRRFHDGAVEPIVSEATPNRRFEGRVTKVAPAADPRSRLFDVELAVSNLDGALRPGMVATVDVGEAGASPASEVVTVPLSAVVRAPEGGDRYAVFLVETAAGGATARLRAIRLGDMVGNEIAVVEGLAEGDRVIVRGATVVTDGERVNPAP